MVGCSLTFFLLFAAFAEPQPTAPAVPSHQQLTTAASWAAERKGSVSWAVIDSAGRIHGRDATRPYASASVSKALLLVAALRRVGNRRRVPADLAGRLRPMIRVSGNRAAHAVYRRLGGDRAFREVARAARLRRLGFAGTWSNLQITAGDVARFSRRRPPRPGPAPPVRAPAARARP